MFWFLNSILSHPLSNDIPLIYVIHEEYPLDAVLRTNYVTLLWIIIVYLFLYYHLWLIMKMVIMNYVIWITIYHNKACFNNYTILLFIPIFIFYIDSMIMMEIIQFFYNNYHKTMLFYLMEFLYIYSIKSVLIVYYLQNSLN